MQNQKFTMRRLWESACIDKPNRPSCVVADGYFVFTINGNRENWTQLCESAGVPDNAEQTITNDRLVCRWLSHADSIFGIDGILAQHLANYEPRLPQLHMARLVQRAIEMNDTALIEAGTGVGKSFAYAAIALAMNKRIVISTSNKALQMQLYQKDIPFLSNIFPGRKVAMVQGKKNYACKAKVEDEMAGAYTVKDELLEWYLQTETGNTEEIPFTPDYKTLEAMTVDDYCTGKHCPHYGDCFYYLAKQKRETAHVLICNHMLLAMHHLYPTSNILPGEIDLIVVDEAHQFAQYVQNALGHEFTLQQLAKRIDAAEKYVDCQTLHGLRHTFNGEISAFVFGKTDPQLGIPGAHTLSSGVELAERMMSAANEIFDENELPSKEDKRRYIDANKVRNLAQRVFFASSPTREGFVRWLETRESKLCNAPYDVSAFIHNMIERRIEPIVIDHTTCTRCHRKLTADRVAILEGKPYGPECIKVIDINGDAEFEDLSAWLNQDTPPVTFVRLAPPVVFCSATLATPDMQAFMAETGTDDALTMIAASPFDYENNALLYVPNGASPQPNNPAFLGFIADEIKELVVQSRGGAFVLFTSYKNMKASYELLQHELERAGMFVCLQGQMPKLEIAKRFREQNNCVLFATKTFWEGVDIQGDNLRLVIIDKMPFAAPSPLMEAQRAALKRYAREKLRYDEKKADWYPFEHLDLPRMILDLKQGAGRLIRTTTDRGVIAILDPRLRSAQYARKSVLPALPPAPLISTKFQAFALFEDMRNPKPKLINEFTPTEQFGLEAGDEELFA